MSAAESLIAYGDTVRSATVRHELPLAIVDPVLYAERDGRRHALVSMLEADRVAAATPDVEQLSPESLGHDELVASGRPDHEVRLEVAARAIERIGIRRASVPGDFPLALAERLRAAGVELGVDDAPFEDRRRRKTDVQLAGIRRAQVAADAAMGAAAQLLRGARVADGRATVDGAQLTAELVRARLREVCAAHGAPAPAEIIVAPGAQAAEGHEPGHGPIAPGAPLIIDIWPQDESTGCFADMTRTFVVGEPPEEVREMHALAREAQERATAAVRAGALGSEVFGAACDVFEAAGRATLRTKRPGEVLHDGFTHGLGHGVGLEIHEPPGLGLEGDVRLRARDVVTIEPGCYRRGFGGVRVEDLVVVGEDGAEVLTRFPYELEP
jgi:Xaa-Pro aminopeptidase